MNQYAQQRHSATILIVDDDPSLRDVLAKTLSMENLSVEVAEDGNQALKILHDNKNIALLLSDVQMQPMSGHELLNTCKQRFPDLPVILMTAYGTVENAVSAIHDGAVDYLVKPFEYQTLVDMVTRFLKPESESACNLIAVDEKSIQLSKVAKRVAATEVTVMITGESGVGKEVVSRYIHDNSTRVNGPFVAINCAAIPENMLESVLFGYEKGAYTGAYKSKAGKFEQAQGGTLLLDEITEMDLSLQAKLLRVLQEREVERLGGSRVIPLDVRIIATTNRDLRQVVAMGQFREDLFYRLNVFPINIPALRERTDDILPLAKKMLSVCVADKVHEAKKTIFSYSAQRMLKAHYWPGNVRELDNVVQRALILRNGNIIEAKDVQFEETANKTKAKTVADYCQSNASVAATDSGLNGDLKAREHDLIISALHTKNSRKEVAEKLGISPRTLRYKIARMRDAGVALPA